MIVRQFLQWQRTASAAERADATSALARCYLHSDLSADDRAAVEGALIMALDDPSPLVRSALAQALAFSEDSPPVVILALAADQSEVATAEACLILIENTEAVIAPSSFSRLVERHGHLGAIREALLARDDLPVSARQALVAKLSELLAHFVVSRAWLEEDRARRVAKEACEKATVTLAAVSAEDEIPPLIRHLRESGQLTAGLVLRALLSGNVEMFEQALANLSGLSLARVSALVHDKSGGGLRALYDRAGLPASTYAAFSEALAAMREGGFVGDFGAATRLRRRMVERVLTRCADEATLDIEPLLTLLRRFATEAAREEARTFCQDLAADDWIEPDAPMRAAA